MNVRHMKARRAWLGLRQQDVADALGVDRGTVAGWETGRRLPEARFIRPLAEILVTSTDELLADPEPQTEAVAASP